MTTNKNFKEWYSKPENKNWMKKYMKEYYKKNRQKLKANQVERKKDMKYNSPAKNKVREQIIKIIEDSNINSILTLESKDFLFSKRLPEKKIVVFEKDKSEFNKMEKKKPKNISLFYGDISKFSELDAKVDVIYLDFCGTFEFEKEVIVSLREQIKQSKLFVVTFSLRLGSEHKKRGYTQIGDYQFDLIRKIQELTEVNWKVLYGEGYRDSTSMVTIVFENPNKNLSL